MYGNSYLCPKGATMRAEKKESKEFKLFEVLATMISLFNLPIAHLISSLLHAVESYLGDICDLIIIIIQLFICRRSRYQSERKLLDSDTITVILTRLAGKKDCIF